MLAALILVMQPKPLDAAALLSKVSETYAKLRSYSDTGECAQKVGAFSQHVKFTTRFQRPQRLYFEYSRDRGMMSGERMVIWPSAGGQSNTWWTIKSQVEVHSLGMALAAAEGVSLGTAYNIPALLTKEVGGNILTLASEMHLVGTGLIGGVQCYKIAYTAQSLKSLVWIDRSTFLIRRIDETTTYNPKAVLAEVKKLGKGDFDQVLPDGMVTDTTVTSYHPVANPKLAASSFSFTPPTK